MTPDVRKAFLSAVSANAEQIQQKSKGDLSKGHWMRAAVVTMQWVSGQLSECNVIDRQIVREMLEKEMPNKEVQGIALAGFEEAFQQLGIN